MEIQNYISCLICLIIALVVMFRLMHYASFYASSYFFWIGSILLVVGIISFVHPLAFLLITNRGIAVIVVFGGLLISAAAILSPVKIKHSQTNDLKIDELMPDYSFNEYHEMQIKTSPEKVKQTLQVTGVKDIPAAHILMKIRGIADDDVDMSDRVAYNNASSNTLSTPDFNFFAVSPGELITVMILKSVIITNNANKPAPPEISTLEQFKSFNKPGYVKVVMNFRLISDDNRNTVLSTETRVNGITHNDSRVFGYYWRIIYPGSAIIRRVWLNTVKKEAES